MRRVPTILLVLFGMLSLAACVNRSVIENQTINYVFEPEVYQHCEDEPLSPGEGATNREWKDSYLDTRDAGRDCREKVDGGRQWADDRRKMLSPENPTEPLQKQPEESPWWKLW